LYQALVSPVEKVSAYFLCQGGSLVNVILEGATKMASRKTYTQYKKIVEALKLSQLDVYRVRTEKGTLKDVLRVYSPAANKVVLVDLGAPRESLSLLEFLDKLVDTLKNEKIPVPERTVKNLREKLSSEKEAVTTSQ
jgi:hypothetical protein